MSNPFPSFQAQVAVLKHSSHPSPNKEGHTDGVRGDGREAAGKRTKKNFFYFISSYIRIPSILTHLFETRRREKKRKGKKM